MEEFHPIWGRDVDAHERLALDDWKREFARLHAAMMALPANRERAVALTYLEECSMRVQRALLDNVTLRGGR